MITQHLTDNYRVCRVDNPQQTRWHIERQIVATCPDGCVSYWRAVGEFHTRQDAEQALHAIPQ